MSAGFWLALKAPIVTEPPVRTRYRTSTRYPAGVRQKYITRFALNLKIKKKPHLTGSFDFCYKRKSFAERRSKPWDRSAAADLSVSRKTLVTGMEKITRVRAECPRVVSVAYTYARGGVVRAARMNYYLGLHFDRHVKIFFLFSFSLCPRSPVLVSSARTHALYPHEITQS